jgi:hypothetical protein
MTPISFPAMLTPITIAPLANEYVMIAALSFSRRFAALLGAGGLSAVAGTGKGDMFAK